MVAKKMFMIVVKKMMKMVLSNMKMMTDVRMLTLCIEDNNKKTTTIWSQSGMITIGCDDHGLPIIVEIHFEATEVKNHLKLSAFLNISKF